MADETVGVLVLFRHGDRQGFYQSPTSYNPTDTDITALGEVQEFQLGQLLRSRYIEANAPYAIEGINSTVFDLNQVNFRADAGGEGSVIYDSAVAVTQGLWPPTPLSNTTLANGTTVISPFNGYQYVGVSSIDPEEDYTLEPWTECPAYAADNAAWYKSDAFKAKAAENQDFLKDLSSVVGSRNVSLENMWNIFDYINVNYIHDAAFMAATPASTWQQARDLANWHEYTSFSDPSPGAIGNIAGRGILPVIFEGLNDIANSSTPTKFYGVGISYKPFISLFNLTGIAEQQPEVAGVVNYAAALAFELRRDTVSQRYSLSILFKNGTDDSDFRQMNMAGGQSSIFLDDFKKNLGPYAISSLGQWCNECENTDSRGCGTIASLNETTSYQGIDSTIGKQHVSPLASGFIGAGVTLAIVAGVLGALWLLGMAAFGRRGMRQNSKAARSEQYSLPAYELKSRPPVVGSSADI